MALNNQAVRPNHKPGAGRPRKIKWGVQCSVYLSPRFKEEYKPLVEATFGVSASYRLNELMLRDLSELQGQALPTAQSIQILESELASIIMRAKKIESFLTKLGVYDRLEDLAIDEFGLNYDTFSNVDSVISKFIDYQIKKGDHFTRDDCELFIQLLGVWRQKTLKKAELDKLRQDRINGKPSLVAAGSLPAPVASPSSAVTGAPAVSQTPTNVEAAVP